MSDSGAIDDLRAVCDRVEREVPLAILEEAIRGLTAALAHTRTVGASRNPDFLGALASLDAAVGEVTTARDELVAAVEHTRAYRRRLG